MIDPGMITAFRDEFVKISMALNADEAAKLKDLAKEQAKFQQMSGGNMTEAQKELHRHNTNRMLAYQDKKRGYKNVSTPSGGSERVDVNSIPDWARKSTPPPPGTHTSQGGTSRTGGGPSPGAGRARGRGSQGTASGGSWWDDFADRAARGAGGAGSSSSSSRSSGSSYRDAYRSAEDRWRDHNAAWEAGRDERQARYAREAAERNAAGRARSQSQGPAAGAGSRSSGRDDFWESYEAQRKASQARWEAEAATRKAEREVRYAREDVRRAAESAARRARYAAEGAANTKAALKGLGITGAVLGTMAAGIMGYEAWRDRKQPKPSYGGASASLGVTKKAA